MQLAFCLNPEFGLLFPNGFYPHLLKILFFVWCKLLKAAVVTNIA